MLTFRDDWFSFLLLTVTKHSFVAVICVAAPRHSALELTHTKRHVSESLLCSQDGFAVPDEENDAPPAPGDDEY